MAFTWTYDAPTTTTANGRRWLVRLNIGDTDENMTPTLYDEEIDAILNGSTDVIGSSITACESLAGKWAKVPSFSVVAEGSISAGDVYDRLLKQADKLRKRSVQTVGSIYVGGASVSENQTMAADTNRVQPTAYQGQFSYTGTDPVLGTVEQEGA